MCLPISELLAGLWPAHGSQKWRLRCIYNIYIYMQVMGEDHEFVTDWLVSQGLHIRNLIYLQQCSYCNTKIIINH